MRCSWSYGVNLTFIGNAIYMSMDIPDTFLAFSKLLNYMRMERLKTVTFAVFLVVWTYVCPHLPLHIPHPKSPTDISAIT
jgi:acyl-CoA-dependent ceramide synthase